MTMTEIKDPFTAYEDVECRDGITRRIYPAKLKHKDQIRKLTPLFNDFAIIDNIFSFDTTAENGGLTIQILPGMPCLIFWCWRLTRNTRGNKSKNF